MSNAVAVVNRWEVCVTWRNDMGGGGSVHAS